MNIKMISCISLDYDLDLIFHFVRHYSKLNISSFHFILHKRENFDIEDYKKYFTYLPSSSLTLQAWCGIFNAPDKIERFNSIIENSEESHILLSDVDEFQNHKQLIEQDYIWGRLVDREPKGKLVKKVDSSNISEQFPIKSFKSNWKDNLKVCVFPASEKLVNSHYVTSPYKNQQTIDIDHYRWTDTRYEKSKERYFTYIEINENKSKTFPNGARLATRDSLNVIKMLKKKTVL